MERRRPYYVRMGGDAGDRRRNLLFRVVFYAERFWTRGILDGKKVS